MKKYTVRNIVRSNNAWKARVGFYKSCFCDFQKNSITVKVFQNKRPSIQDFIDIYKKLS